jgi:phage/plasmid-associated DNA primase
MKALSGGDVMSLNPKGKDRRSQICFTKQVLGTNNPLKLQQYDEAFWERVEIIPYMYSISPEERICDLEDMLFLERDAIVTKCMKAARRLIKAGYRFPDCLVADEMKSEWTGWKTQAKVFLHTHCVAEKGSFTPSTPLYEKYLQHCQENALAYGTMTGFITLAKQMFPSNGNPHPMIDGVQLRGLPDVRFMG